MLSKRAFIPI